ncbi:MAG TPA: ABC transporter substrate-binding protein [Pyrinomonadaceae bacterium]|jgi:branched-chain amino acid transport system substrate-binding protein|nr:ABC transporter substrate-binding protein [Pyrinomonadaceae bacterium]
MKKIIALMLVLALTLISACQQKGASNTVKVGVFMPQTGATATFGISSVNAIRMAAEEVNAAGGINGKQVELVVYDDRSDAQEAATVVTKLVSQDGVSAILGEVASTRSIAAAPIAQSNKVPMLTPSSTNPEVTKKGDYIFRSCFTDPVQGEAIAKFAATKLNAKRAALLIDKKNDYSVGLGNFIKESYGKMGGQIVVEQFYQEGDTDFNAQLTSIKGSNPDVIFVPGYYTEIGLIAQQAKRQGINAPLLGGDGWDSPRLYEIGGTSLIGSYFSNHYSADDPDPAVQKFVGSYKSKYGQVPDALAATAYDAALILFDAIKRANSTDGTAIRDALAKTVNFKGVTGIVTINSQRDAVKPIIMIKVEEGGKYGVADRVYPEGTAPPTSESPSPTSSASPASSASPTSNTSPAVSPSASPAASPK